MIQPIGLEILVICVLIFVSDYHNVLCSSLNYESDDIEIEHSIQDVKGTRLRVKRFVLDDAEEAVSETTDEYEDSQYDGDEISNAEKSSEETFDFASNMKPKETTTVPDATNRPLTTISSLTTRLIEEPTTNDCFFNGRYYPVNATVHMDEVKCFIVACIKSSTREPPSTQVNDFGTGCCTHSIQMYRDGTRVGDKICQKGNWTAEASTTPNESKSLPPTVSSEETKLLPPTVSEETKLLPPTTSEEAELLPPTVSEETKLLPPTASEETELLPSTASELEEAELLPPTSSEASKLSPPTASEEAELLPPTASEETALLPPTVSEEAELLPPTVSEEAELLPPTASEETELLPSTASELEEAELLPPTSSEATKLSPPTASEETELLPPTASEETELLPPTASEKTELLPPPVSEETELLTPTVSERTELSSTTTEASMTPLPVEAGSSASTDMVSDTSGISRTLLYTTPTIPALDQQTFAESADNEESSTEPEQHKTETSTGMGTTLSTPQELTSRGGTSTTSSRVKPGEEGPTTAAEMTKPSSEVTERAVESSSALPFAGISTGGVEVHDTSGTLETHEDTDDIVVYTGEPHKSTEAFTGIRQETGNTETAESQSTMETSVSVEGEAEPSLEFTREPGVNNEVVTDIGEEPAATEAAETQFNREISVTEGSTSTEEVTTSPESAVTPGITVSVTGVLMKSIEELTRMSPESSASEGVETQPTKETSFSEESSAAGVTTSPEPAVTPGINITVTGVLMESSERLASISPESTATEVAEEQSAKETNATEGSTATGVTTSSKIEVSPGLTDTATGESMESMKGLTRVGPQSKGSEIQPTKKIGDTEETTTTEGLTTSPASIVSPGITHTSTDLSMESTGGLSRMSPESTATEGAETPSTEDIDTSKETTAPRGVTTSLESSMAPGINVTAAGLSIENPEGLVITSPAGTKGAETQSTKEIGVFGETTATGGVTTSLESTMAPDINVTAAGLSMESTEGLVITSPAGTKAAETQSTKEIGVFGETTATGGVTTSPESTMAPGINVTATGVSMESTEGLVITSPAGTKAAETQSTKEIGVLGETTATGGVTASLESTMAPGINVTAAGLSMESTEGLVITSPAGTKAAETQSTKEIGVFGETTATGGVTTSLESTMAPGINVTAAGLSMESTEGLVITSPAGTKAAETQSTKEIGASEEATATGGVTTSLESTMAPGINVTAAGLSMESTEGSPTYSPAGAKYNETLSIKKISITEEGTAPRVTTSSESTLSPGITEAATDVTMASIEGLASMILESTATEGVEKQATKEIGASEDITATKGVPASADLSGYTEGQGITGNWDYLQGSKTPQEGTSTETSKPSVTFSSPGTSTPEQPTTSSPDEFTCRWDNMTVSTSGTIFRDPTRCLNVECWHTVHGAFIDVTIVHEARGCCELQDKRMVPTGYIGTTKRGEKKRCLFGRWHTQYFDAAINMTSSKQLSFKNKTYHFFPRLTPIEEALAICEKINGTLAVPDNREQEMELGQLGAEAFGGQATFYINQDKIQQHVMNGHDKDHPDKYIAYPHDSSKMMHINVNKPGTAYAVESFVENIQRVSVPICEQGGKNESFPEYFNNLVSIGTLTNQGLPKEAAYHGMQHGKNSETLAKMHEWRLPPVPRKYRAGHSNIGRELRRWGQLHKDLAYAIKNRRAFKDPLPIYKANHFNEK